jgi:MoxR-like ATPase
MCVAASNEWPSGDDGKELNALFDRFLFRKTVKPVSPVSGRKAILQAAMTGGPPQTFSQTVTAKEVNAACDEAATLDWTPEAKKSLWKILGNLNAEGIFPGDRRTMKGVNAVRAAAFLAGKRVCDTDDLSVLQHVLWDDPEEQPQKAAKIILSEANPALVRVNELMLQMASVVDAKTSPTEKVPKLQEVQRSLQKVQKGDKRDLAIKACEGHIKRLFQEVTGGAYED